MKIDESETESVGLEWVSGQWGVSARSNITFDLCAAFGIRQLSNTMLTSSRFPPHRTISFCRTPARQHNFKSKAKKPNAHCRRTEQIEQHDADSADDDLDGAGDGYGQGSGTEAGVASGAQREE